MEISSSGFAAARFFGMVFAVFLIISGSRVLAAPQVPAMFVFGDSLVDNGNNNYLASLAKSNYMPYGIDFFQGPTGRFCNGKTIVDFLGELLGLPYVLPFADPNSNGTKILSGLNYASAAAGILDETGQNYGERIALSQQVLNFENTLETLRQYLGGRLGDYLSRSIVVLVFGSNDYINNYLMPSMYSTFNCNPKAYANLLINHYTRQLLALHSLGLRKFFVAGVGPLGCIPNQLAIGLAPPGTCISYTNEILGFYNVGLRDLVAQLNANHPGATFVYGNVYGVFGDMLNNPTSFGFRIVDRGCCGLVTTQAVTCLPLSIPCANRSEYIFWDAFHPTEAANRILARRAYSGAPSDCYPINVQQMAQI